MGNDQRRLVHLLDHVGHGKGLAGPGDAKKRLTLVALFEARHQLFYGLRLIAGGLVFTVQLKMIHERPPLLKAVFIISQQKEKVQNKCFFVLYFSRFTVSRNEGFGSPVSGKLSCFRSQYLSGTAVL